MNGNNRLLVVAGVGTALLGSFALDSNSDYSPRPSSNIAYQMSLDSYSARPAEVGGHGNSYVDNEFTVLDLAADLSAVSRNFTKEEASGYSEFIDSFFS